MILDSHENNKKFKCTDNSWRFNSRDLKGQVAIYCNLENWKSELSYSNINKIIIEHPVHKKNVEEPRAGRIMPVQNFYWSLKMNKNPCYNRKTMPVGHTALKNIG